MTYRKMLFVCLGNSCTSPMAEAIMQNLMVKTSLYWEVDSAGLRTWNIGRRPHKHCLRILKEHGLRSDHFCRLFTVEDFRYYDFIVAMNLNVYKELLLWAGLNNNSRHCELKLLSWYGTKGQPTLINEVSPTNKLKVFRDVYYQIKECCKQFILNQEVNIIQYDVPSTDDEEPEQLCKVKKGKKTQKLQITLDSPSEPVNVTPVISPSSSRTPAMSTAISKEPISQHFKILGRNANSQLACTHKKKLCHKCGLKFLSTL